MITDINIAILQITSRLEKERNQTSFYYDSDRYVSIGYENGLEFALKVLKGDFED